MMESTTIDCANGATPGNNPGSKTSNLLTSLLVEESSELTGDSGQGGGGAVGGGGGGSATSGKSDNLFDDSDPIAEEADANLFGSLGDPSTGSGYGGGTTSNLLGQLLGGITENVTNADVSAASSAPSANASSTISASVDTTAAPTATVSKLSSSGLLENCSNGGDDLFQSASGDGGFEGGSGLFDEIDAEEAEKGKEKQAEKDRQLQFQQQQQQDEGGVGVNDTPFENGVMHDLNLNDTHDASQYNQYNMGMGMGVGGAVPSEPQFQPHGQPEKMGQPGIQGQHGQQPGQYPYQPQMNAMAGSYYYSTTGAGQMQGQPQPHTSPSRGSNLSSGPQPSVLAGMHVGHDVNLGGVPGNTNLNAGSGVHGGVGVFGGMAHGTSGLNVKQHRYSQPHSSPQAPNALSDYSPAPFDPIYGKIVVNDPMLIQGTGLFAGPPHWTYLVTVYAKNDTNANGSNNANKNVNNPNNPNNPSNQSPPHQPKPISAVRRRFRHFVALEDRLRTSVPGAILPPRPDKHPARAIEEATARQSADFAMQRAQELTVYMDSLAHHPHAGMSPELKLFLTLQDHIGTAWPEVSSSAFTRMTAVGTATVEKLSDTMDGMMSELGTAQQVAAGEDSAEILALAAYEGRRIGAVTSSVPKMEGAMGLLRERGDRLGATGLELSKLAKDVAWCDKELSGPMEVLASALLRCGRRSKRLGLEVGAAMAPFVSQYRMCRYEQMAFADRRASLKRRTEARVKADGRAAKLMMNQASMQGMGRLGTLERMETEAAMSDEFATEAAREADEVAMRLQSEVSRITALRVKEWDASMKVIACGMKEAYAEKAAIWEGALDSFKNNFPEMSIPEVQSIPNPTMGAYSVS